jgi:hypothetical protein
MPGSVHAVRPRLTIKVTVQAAHPSTSHSGFPGSAKARVKRDTPKIKG